ncbi:MAG: hypothetical protein U9Q99_00125 [Nanoarchaeota archaeon]|nr:hypothetical protein [Nanoarchaeota archaeon]
MGSKTIKKVCNYLENNKEISCDFNGKKLNDLEEILNIAKSRFQKIENVDFFEFGSQEWNPSHYGPRSGMGAHFMGTIINLSYKCFDAFSEPKDFDANIGLIDAYKTAEKQESKYNGLIVKYKDSIFWEAKENFESLNKNKDLSDTFVMTRNEEYFKNFYEFYEGVDLNELKKEIEKFSIDDYDKISEKINESSNPIVYSNNVLNAPNLTNKFNFWNIENTFHIHSGNIHELSKNLGVNLGWRFSVSKGEKFDMKKELIYNFKSMFDLFNYNINIQNNTFRYFLFWNS